MAIPILDGVWKQGLPIRKAHGSAFKLLVKSGMFASRRQFEERRGRLGQTIRQIKSSLSVPRRLPRCDESETLR